MREIVFFVASLAGAAILTALAVLNPEASLLWKNILRGGIAVLAICALALFIDIIRSRIARRQKAPASTETPPIPSETIWSRDHHWQFDSQMAVAIAARLRSRPEWQDKIIVDVTPEHIWNLFRGCSTSMEGDMLTRRFLNKWMVVCGPFGNVRRLLGNIMVVRSAIRNDLAIVFMYFNEDSHDALELLIPKQKIYVVGRIDIIQSDSLNLEDCKLVQ
jgi:hypothetical protein